jgi:Domain of unknown function (DUF5668)
MGHRNQRLIPGLILIVMGLFFLLENLNIIFVEDWWRYWPLLLIAVGFAKLVQIFRVA